ncbi:MAG TPA: Ig-like domain-containing protein, partial [Kofleriaceae bacterium]|nr:Ig-like domain-containing protein [Kofleriaceae bacterium]
MRAFAIIALAAAAGCADKAYDPNAPAIDPNAPRIHITSPARGTFAGDVHEVTVTGTATDDTAVTSVTVNGVAATFTTDGTWTAEVPVTAGTNLLHAIATDAQGNAGKESRAVVAGPMANLAQEVPQGITATLSAQTFQAIGKGTAGFLTQGDLAPMVASSNPVWDLGGGPDCLYVQASITSVTF